ncbi:MAG: MarR family transcriptional regulator [Anaerolineaceae bacterium]|jgi:DNA-binding MarR family transcriptional regulator|nr:MarR family transcriptional regulator [Anaerolineaceae bacterium]OQY90005.1 MAG: hypothetical protein B6D38_05405 [Anaerolineae bacterium UTCFX1]
MNSSSRIDPSLRAWMEATMHRSMRGWIRFARSSGLSLPQFSVLMQLRHRGSFGMSEIAEKFEITPAAASQLTEKLVQAGYIERIEDPNDRRAKLLRLSKAGEKFVVEGVEERYRWINDLTKRLSAEEQAKISEALTILIKAMEGLIL